MVEDAEKIEKEATDFEAHIRRAGEGSDSPPREFLYLIARTRKYWMLPIIIGLLAVGFLVVTSGTVVAPIIYTLF